MTMVNELRPEYSLAETIRALQKWSNGGRMYPVEVANSAVHWLRAAKLPEGYADEVLAALESWLEDESPHIPDGTATEALFWLCVVRRLHRGEPKAEPRNETGS
jgi:hypothetical protein